MDDGRQEGEPGRVCELPLLPSFPSSMPARDWARRVDAEAAQGGGVMKEEDESCGGVRGAGGMI